MESPFNCRYPGIPENYSENSTPIYAKVALERFLRKKPNKSPVYFP
jgi:hypothetical protein